MTDDDRAALLDQVLSYLPDEAFQWRSRAAAVADAGEELAPAIDRCTDFELAGRRSEWIGVGVVDDYLERLVDFEDGKLLCGIRFYGQDPKQPFVDLVASTRPIRDLGAAVALALELYAVFGVSEARVFRPGVVPPMLQARGDQVLVAAPLGTVAGGVSPAITLRNADIGEAEQFVEERYAAFAQARPAVAKLVVPATADDLTDCRDDGRLCWFDVDGERAGLIGVRRNTQCGIAGFEVVEELTAGAFLGQRVAAAAQRRLAATLLADGESPTLALLGTIAFDNQASRRAAQTAGRNEIAAWWFVKPS